MTLANPSPIYPSFFVDNEAESQNLNNMINSEVFKSATTYRDQVGLICSNLRNEKNLVSYEKIAKIFKTTRFSIQEQNVKYINGANSTGKPPSLNENK